MLTSVAAGRFAPLMLVLTVAGCGADPKPGPDSTPWNDPSIGKADASSGTPVERFFPLVDGHIYQYVTENEAGTQGMLIARVHRTDDRRGELRFPAGVKRFQYVIDGVSQTSGSGASSYVLKTPLTKGNSWRGEHGGTTRIEAIDLAVQTLSGNYTGCLQTVEEKRGDAPIRFTTTFCPDVGVVRLEATSGLELERAELKSYAPPVDIGPEGLHRLP